MKKYNVKLSKQAETDLYSYVNHISCEYGAPLTALKHYEELSGIINDLKTNPEQYSVRHTASLRRYGTNVRRINYKKMAVIYTIHNDLVYIHRIIAGALL